MILYGDKSGSVFKNADRARSGYQDNGISDLCDFFTLARNSNFTRLADWDVNLHLVKNILDYTQYTLTLSDPHPYIIVTPETPSWSINDQGIPPFEIASIRNGKTEYDSVPVFGDYTVRLTVNPAYFVPPKLPDEFDLEDFGFSTKPGRIEGRATPLFPVLKLSVHRGESIHRARLYDYAFQKNRRIEKYNSTHRDQKKFHRVPRLRAELVFSGPVNAPVFIRGRCFYYADSSDWHRPTSIESFVERDGLRHPDEVDLLELDDGVTTSHIVCENRFRDWGDANFFHPLNRAMFFVVKNNGEDSDGRDYSGVTVCNIMSSYLRPTHQTVTVGNRSASVFSAIALGDMVWDGDGEAIQKRVDYEIADGAVLYKKISFDDDEVGHEYRAYDSRSGLLASRAHYCTGLSRIASDTDFDLGLDGERPYTSTVSSASVFAYDSSGRLLEKETTDYWKAEPVTRQKTALSWEQSRVATRSVKFPAGEDVGADEDLTGLEYTYKYSPKKRVTDKGKREHFAREILSQSTTQTSRAAADVLFFILGEITRFSSACNRRDFIRALALLAANVQKIYNQRSSITSASVQSIIYNSQPTVIRLSGYFTSDQNAVVAFYLASIQAHFGCLKTAEQHLAYLTAATDCICARPELTGIQLELCDVALYGIEGLGSATSCADGYSFDPDLIAAAADVCSVHFTSLRTDGSDLIESKKSIDDYIRRAQPVPLPDEEKITLRVINIALARSGTSKQLKTLNDGTTEATVADTLFRACVRKILTAQRWSFAIQDTQLTTRQNTTLTPERWPLSARLPADCLSVVEIWAGQRNPPMDAVFPYELAGRRLYCEVENPWVRYVYKAPLTEWPEIALDALAWELAAELTMPLTVKPDLAALLFQKAQLELERAFAHDRNQQQPDPSPDSRFVRVRN